MIVWLEVPFAQKDEAKQRGALWCRERKKWFVKNAKTFSPYIKWMSDDDRRAFATTGIGELCSDGLSQAFERAIGKD